jgi:hypothetical protein
LLNGGSDVVVRRRVSNTGINKLPRIRAALSLPGDKLEPLCIRGSGKNCNHHNN